MVALGVALAVTVIAVLVVVVLLVHTTRPQVVRLEARLTRVAQLSLEIEQPQQSSRRQPVGDDRLGLRHQKSLQRPGAVPGLEVDVDCPAGCTRTGPAERLRSTSPSVPI
jgi:hypothetical protein